MITIHIIANNTIQARAIAEELFEAIYCKSTNLRKHAIS